MELDGDQENVALPGGIASSYYRRISRVPDDDSISQAGRTREDPTPTPRDRQPPTTATEFRQPSPTPTLPESPTSVVMGSSTPDINMLLTMLVSTQQKLVELQTQQALANQQPRDSGSGAKVADPVRFTGADQSKLEPWLFQISLVFGASPSCFRSDEVKITYALSWLAEPIQSHFAQLEKAGETHLRHDWKSFVDHLQSTFGSQDPVGDAVKALRTISMPENQQIMYYKLEFDRYASRVTNRYGPGALINFFYKGLPSRLKDGLLSFQIPTELRVLREITRMLDKQWWQRELEQGRGPAPPPTNSFSSHIRGMESNYRRDHPAKGKGSGPNNSNSPVGQSGASSGTGANTDRTNRGKTTNPTSASGPTKKIPTSLSTFKKNMAGKLGADG